MPKLSEIDLTHIGLLRLIPAIAFFVIGLSQTCEIDAKLPIFLLSTGCLLLLQVLIPLGVRLYSYCCITELNKDVEFGLKVFDIVLCVPVLCTLMAGCVYSSLAYTSVCFGSTDGTNFEVCPKNQHCDAAVYYTTFYISAITSAAFVLFSALYITTFWTWPLKLRRPIWHFIRATVSLFFLVSSSIHLYDCEIDFKIPIFLLVIGCLGVLSVILVILTERFRFIDYNKKDYHPCDIAIGVGILILFLAAFVCVVRAKDVCFYFPDCATEYHCNIVIYYVAYWTSIPIAIVFVIFLCVLAWGFYDEWKEEKRVAVVVRRPAKVVNIQM